MFYIGPQRGYKATHYRPNIKKNSGLPNIRILNDDRHNVNNISIDVANV